MKIFREKVTGELDNFFAIADEERNNYINYITSTPAPTPNIINPINTVEDVQQIENSTSTPTPSPTEKPPFQSKKLIKILNSDQTNAILNCTQNEYALFKKTVSTTFEKSLLSGIKSEDLDKDISFASKEIDNLTLNKNLSEIGSVLVTNYFETNQSIDAAATQKAIDDAVLSVKPVIFINGQTVVNDGQIVTDEIYTTLDSLGYIDKSLSEKRLPIAGMIIILISIFIACIVFFKSTFNNKPLKFNESIMFLLIYLTSITLIFLLSSLPVFFSPALASIMLISIFFGFKNGTFYTIFITIVSCLIINGDQQYAIFILTSGLFLSVASKKIFERKNLLYVTASVAFFNSLIYIGTLLLFQNKIDKITFYYTGYIFIYSVGMVVLCFGLIPLFEIFFSILTPNKLMELSNPNNPLLKKLVFEAPGTYHHSLIVANLAEAAAMEIGADYNLARVAAYYHDIGKTKHPIYFSENQVGENPHDNISPFESFEIIKSHVDYGIELAKKHKFPKEIIKFIPEHHGNTLIAFFYAKAKEQAENPEDITMDMFRYNGATPSTKEAGILMLADTCEAAVRSVITKGKSMDEVELFIRKLIKGKIEDNQMLNSNLTFLDIEKIVQAFMRIFKGMYHERVAYPQVLKKEDDNGSFNK